jgi:hypothetical protein
MVENIEKDSIERNCNNLNSDDLESQNNKINDENQRLFKRERQIQNEYFNDLINNSNNNNNSMEKNNISSKLELSRYKSKKLFGINFYYIGNVIVFGFVNDNSDPLFCIDSMWYFHLIIYIILIILLFVGNHYLFSKLELWKQIIYNVLLFLFFICYSVIALLNPGIIIRSEKGHKHIGYCKKCNLFFLPEENIYHCFDCNVCVKQLDHHCSVVRKCITKKNFVYFILMIVSFVLVYVYSLINLIFFLIDYYQKIKK